MSTAHMSALEAMQSAPLPAGAAIDPTRARANQVYDLLRNAIVSLWLKPGIALNEKAIAAQLLVSKTPVRDAVRRLSSEGLVDVYPQSGTFVAPIRLSDVQECQMVREALELAVARRAAERVTAEDKLMFRRLLAEQEALCAARDIAGLCAADEAFHRAISMCAGTPRVWSIINSGKAQLERVRRLAMPEPGRARRALAEHAAVAEALTAGAGEAAAAALKLHLDTVHATIRALIEHHGGAYFDLNGQPAETAPRRSRP